MILKQKWCNDTEASYVELVGEKSFLCVIRMILPALLQTTGSVSCSYNASSLGSAFFWKIKRVENCIRRPIYL